MDVRQYHERPASVEAVQLPTRPDLKAFRQVAAWCGGKVMNRLPAVWVQDANVGGQYAKPGWWVLRDCEGRFHTLSDPAFQQRFVEG